MDSHKQLIAGAAAFAGRGEEDRVISGVDGLLSSKTPLRRLAVWEAAI